MTTGVSGLDVLALLDIIKNEELYTQKLNEIRAAEKSLAEAKYIAATVAQASKYRDDAAKIKEEAVALKLKIEEELAAKKQKFDAEMAEVWAKVDNEKSKAIESLSQARATLKAAEDQAVRNAGELERLKKYDTMLSQKEAAYVTKHRDFTNRLAQARELLGQE